MTHTMKVDDSYYESRWFIQWDDSYYEYYSLSSVYTMNSLNEDYETWVKLEQSRKQS